MVYVYCTTHIHTHARTNAPPTILAHSVELLNTDSAQTSHQAGLPREERQHQYMDKHTHAYIRTYTLQ